MAPEYEKAAVRIRQKELNAELFNKPTSTGPQMSLAEVNCEERKSRKLCQIFKITGFPRLLLFKNGKLLEQYKGERTAKHIEAFMNKHFSNEL